MSIYRSRDYKVTFRLKGIKRVLLFGSGVGGSNIISYIGSNFMEMTIAKSFSVSELGIFGRAKSTITLFSTAILDATTPLVTPYYANTNNNSESLSTAYLKSTQPILYIAFPFCSLLVVAPETIIHVLYGTNWLNSAPYISLLAINLAIYLLSVFYDRCLIAMDMPKQYFWFRVTFTTIQIFLILFLINQGIQPILYGLIAASCIRLAWSLISLNRIIKLDFTEYLHMAWAPLKAGSAFTIGLMPYIIFGNEKDLVAQVTLLGSAPLAWILFIWLFDKPFNEIVFKILKRN